MFTQVLYPRVCSPKGASWVRVSQPILGKPAVKVACGACVARARHRHSPYKLSGSYLFSTFRGQEGVKVCGRTALSIPVKPSPAPKHRKTMIFMQHLCLSNFETFVLLLQGVCVCVCVVADLTYLLSHKPHGCTSHSSFRRGVANQTNVGQPFQPGIMGAFMQFAMLCMSMVACVHVCLELPTECSLRFCDRFRLLSP